MSSSSLKIEFTAKLNILFALAVSIQEFINTTKRFSVKGARPQHTVSISAKWPWIPADGPGGTTTL